MARFSGQIKSAKFIDQEEKVVEVLYGEDPKSLTAFNVPVDYNSPVFTDLLDEVSFEEIQDNTKLHFTNIMKARDNIIHHAATEMFEDWVNKAQQDLDKQDAERYRIFEEYKNTVLETLQLEADKQVLERVNEEYEKIQSIIDQQYAKVQEVVDAQVKERVDKAYGEVQLEVDKQVQEGVQKEYEKVQQVVDAQVKERVDKEYENVQAVIDEQYKQVQSEVDKQAEEQVQSRVAEEYEKIDQYKKEQLENLQKDVDIQIKERYKEVDGYKLQQLEKAREELKKNFKVATPAKPSITTNDLINAFLEKTEDEDLLFKTKLELFNKPEVKNNKDRNLKMKIRKSKTIPELFAAYQECLI